MEIRPAAGVRWPDGRMGWKGRHLMATVKEEARQVIERLPEHATWDDLMYELYVRQKIAAGIKAADEGRVVSHEEVRKKFLS